MVNLVEWVPYLFSVKRKAQLVLGRVSHFFHVLERKEYQRAVGISSVANLKRLSMFEVLFVMVSRKQGLVRRRGDDHRTDFTVAFPQQFPSLICVSQSGFIAITKLHKRYVQRRCCHQSSQPECAENAYNRGSKEN